MSSIRLDPLADRVYDAVDGGCVVAISFHFDFSSVALQLDDTLPTLAADPDTIRDASKAVGGDTQVTGERRRP